MSRIIWKGAITFGLVNIPVVLRRASRSQTIDLDRLDVRDMAQDDASSDSGARAQKGAGSSCRRKEADRGQARPGSTRACQAYRARRSGA